MTSVPIHLRFGTMYTYFIKISSKYEYLPERRVTATLCVCVNASIFTKQFSPVRPVRTVVHSAGVSHRFIE